jgi:hypothetical protein
MFLFPIRLEQRQPRIIMDKRIGRIQALFKCSTRQIACFGGWLGDRLCGQAGPRVAPSRSLTIGTPERSQSDHCGIAQDRSSGSERRRRRTRRSCDLKGPHRGGKVLKRGMYEAAALHGVAANRSCFHSLFLRQLQRVSIVHTGL